MSISWLPRTWSRSGRLWLGIALVLAMLLAEYVLPVRLAGQGFSGLFFLIAAALAALVLPRPWLGLAVLLAYGPFAAAVRFGGASSLQSLVKDFLALGIVAAWLVGMFMERKKWARTPLDLPLVLFLALMGVQVLHGPSLLRGILAVKVLALYIPVYWLVVNNPPSRSQLRRILWVVLAVAAVTAVYGLYQSQTFTEAQYLQIEGETFLTSSRENRVRVFSTFTHSVVFSLYLSLMATLVLSLLLHAPGRHKIWLVIVLALLVAVMPWTLSRVGWIGLVLGILVLISTAPKRSQRVSLLFLGALAGVLFVLTAAPAARDTLSWSFTEQDVSFQGRQLFLSWSYNTLLSEVPLGCGMGVLGDAADLAARLTHTLQPEWTCVVSGGKFMQAADTVVLAVGAQMGVPGYLLYSWIFVTLWWGGTRAYRHIKDRELKALAAGLLGYLAIMTVSNWFSGSTQAYPVVDLYFWFFAGLLMSLERIEQQWSQRDIATRP